MGLTAEFVGERSPLLLEHVGDHDVRALGDEATRVAGAIPREPPVTLVWIILSSGLV